jgi:N,N'-diacetyllegionaminate synthase
LKIGPHYIHVTDPVFVIAEIGVNHDGSVERALELVGLARQCGADAVKLQVFRAEQLMHGSSQFAEYQKQAVDDADPLAMLRRYELTGSELARVTRAVEQAGMVPIATPFSPDDVPTIDRLNMAAIKIASPDVVNRPLLQRAARTGRPMIVSTGAANPDEIQMCCDWLRQWKADYCLLHCVSSYPTPRDSTNLCWIGELARQFGVSVGYSDHSTEIISGALAVAAGACIVERHLTYDRKAAGPDHAASSDPGQFSHYVKLVRQAESMRGLPGKRVLTIEQDVRQVSRQSLVCRRDLAAGQVVREEDLTVQRPGTGIPAAMIESAVGKKMTKPVKAGSMLSWDMLKEAA